ncbi:choice-of-anchor Q domain-containing protein [Caldilinea sp.]|uniref:choice-of-anchor Q domain-containing protein n=1 Tax=Caldilinea sp. TaxID=2293560 RepID=UPI002C0911F5|nr:choice-of-anchor Q domain-containing protein [Caldilinea sp.]HRA64589.1 choice-of-anchor Q domain-containing protein [Caldilinea sp.]
MGGGIYQASGTADISGSTFNGNVAWSGGGMYMMGGAVTIAGSTFTNNGAEAYDGGAMVVASGVVTMSNSQVLTNSAATAGGGLYIVNGGVMTIANSKVLANQSTANNTAIGGGIYNNGALFLNVVNVSQNSAWYAGGGVYNDGNGILMVARSLVNFNATEVGHSTLYSYPYYVYGGAIWNNGALTTTDSIFVGNHTFATGTTVTDFATYGYAIANIGTLEMSQVYMADNTMGAIYNRGVADASNSYIANNVAVNLGGAITNDTTGILSLSDSNLSMNVAVWVANNTSSGGNTTGGGIYNSGVVTITGSSLIQNVAAPGPQGANDWGSGGAIYNSGAVNLQNSTVVASTQSKYGGGIDNFYSNPNCVGCNNDDYTGLRSSGSGLSAASAATAPVLTLNHATLVGNGQEDQHPVLRNGEGAVLHMRNSIIADSPCANNGSIGANRHNLIEDGSCADNGVNLHTGDARLGALAYNGGSTPTVALLPGSPAADAAELVTCLATDQRGFARPHGQGCDIGAFESQPWPRTFLPLVAR